MKESAGGASASFLLPRVSSKLLRSMKATASMTLGAVIGFYTVTAFTLVMAIGVPLVIAVAMKAWMDSMEGETL